jgi:hypothetical protein
MVRAWLARHLGKSCGVQPFCNLHFAIDTLQSSRAESSSGRLQIEKCKLQIARESTPRFERKALGVGIIFVALLGIGGCGKDAPVEVQPQSGLERAKGILNDYANGAPLGSEGAMYEEIVAEVRQTDPQKATILEKGFADLKRSPQNLSGKARALLKQL